MTRRDPGRDPNHIAKVQISGVEHIKAPSIGTWHKRRATAAVLMRQDIPPAERLALLRMLGLLED